MGGLCTSVDRPDQVGHLRFLSARMDGGHTVVFSCASILV